MPATLTKQADKRQHGREKLWNAQKTLDWKVSLAWRLVGTKQL